MIPAHENPFRSTCIEALPYHISDSDYAELWSRFRSQQYRGILVGAHGSGKTTLREQLEQHLRSEGHHVHTIILQDTHIISWNLLSQQLSQTTPDTIVSIDGLDRLNAVLWWRLAVATRAQRGLLATSHVPGRLPLLRQHHTSPQLLMELVQHLTADHHVFTAACCQQLFARHRGNIRNCLRELYDTWEQLTVCTR